MEKIESVRGMNDILPEQSPYWHFIEAAIRQLMTRFSYQEIRFPIVESTQLFTRSIGDVTDIVEKEMYTFADRNGDSISLRPEGTASCVRACLQYGLIHNQQRRLFYMGPVFRHERPQKGRYRQFHQFGVETFGMPGPDIEAELIQMMSAFWQTLGLSQHITLEINTLGNPTVRQQHLAQLTQYFNDHKSELDADSQKRLTRNPLRILDSKNPMMQTLNDNAPKLIDFLDEESALHFETLKRYLNHLNIEYRVNPRLVRGLDYYCHSVFEWVTNDLGSQNAVCAGGRYDGLVKQLGGRQTPAVGFAMGLERVILLLQKFANEQVKVTQPQVYFITETPVLYDIALTLTQALRQALPDLRLICHCGGGTLKSQFKKADQSGAELVLILTEAENQTQQIAIKTLREAKPQRLVRQSDLISAIMAHFKGQDS